MKKEISVNTQPVASIIRQAAAAAAVVMGLLTSALGSIKLPPAVSTVLVAIGGGLFWIEQHVGDPSTGNTVPTDTAAIHKRIDDVEQKLSSLSATPPA